jgi:hypothetical protein
MLIKKIGGNWHKVETWNDYVIGYKSGGIVIVDPAAAETKELYIPFYDFSGFSIEENTLYIRDKQGQIFYLDLGQLKSGEHKVRPYETSPAGRRGEPCVHPAFIDSTPDQFDTETPTVEGLLEEPRAMDENDRFIVVAYKQKGIDFFRAGDGEKIVHFDFPGYSFVDDITLHGNTLYIADVFGLRILDITDLNNLRIDDRYTHYKGWAKDAAIYKRYLLVADVLGIKIFDKQKNFNMVGKIESNRNRVAKVVTNGDYAFLSCEAVGLKIADLTDISNPRLISGIVMPAGVWDCAMYGDYAYLAAYTGGLKKVNCSNKKNLEQEKEYHDEEIIGVHVNDRAVYAACSYNGFKILDHNLNLIAAVNGIGGRCWTVLETGGYMFAAAGDEGVYVYEAKDLKNPVLVNRIKTAQARDLITRGNFLYVADGRNGALVYNIADIDKIECINKIPSAAFTRSIMVDEAYIYKADGDGGAEVYER